MNETCEGTAFSEQHSSSINKPGAILRQARERQGIARERVCRELGLTCRLLDALEADDCDRLPAPVYVKGYLRRYCELLGLRVGPVLGAYDELLGDAVANTYEPGSSSRHPRTSGLMLAGSVSALALICTVVFWAVYSEGREITSQPLQSRLAQRTDPVQSDAVASDTLSFVFHQDSWVEVVDARDHILAVELRRAGTTLTVDGVPPFDVVLGNGPGVSVSYRGKPVSPGAVADDRRAQFTVGR